MKSYQIFIVSLLLSVFLVFFLFRGFVFSVVSGPLLAIHNGFSWIKIYTNALMQLPAIVRENEKLFLENSEQLQTQADLILAREENERLRRQLGVQVRENRTLIIADIFYQTKNPLFQRLMINKGSKEGIEVGDAVVVPGNIFLGSVAEVLNSVAVVKTVWDAATVVSVDALESNVTGIVRYRNGKLILDLVNADETLLRDDILVTNGLDEMPKGLRVGKVESIQELKADILKRNVIKPLVRPHATIVFVIKKINDNDL